MKAASQLDIYANLKAGVHPAGEGYAEFGRQLSAAGRSLRESI